MLTGHLYIFFGEMLDPLTIYLFKKIFIYLAAPGLSCSTWDLRCRVRDLCCGTWDVLVMARKLLVAVCGI